MTNPNDEQQTTPVQPIIVNNVIGGPGYYQRVAYPWGGHLLMTLLTGFFWLPIWLLCYLFRDQSKYL